MTDLKDEANACLTRIRQEISDVDLLLLANLQKRLSLVKQAGAVKKKAGLPIIVPEVEEEMIRRYHNLANTEHYPAELLDQLAKSIINLARYVQNEPK